MMRIGVLASLVVMVLWGPHFVYAGNPPDQGKSTISGTSAPADGNGTSTVKITLKDSSGALLTSNDTVNITSSDSSASFSPSSVTMDGSGVITTQMKTTTVGNVPVTVTDVSTGNTQITGSVAFYQPGTASPTPTPTPGPSTCTDSAPGSTAKLTSAVSAGLHSITLTWTDAANPVTYYLLSYGLSSGNYIYGNPNIGGQGTTSYTVGGLNTGTKYYFVVRAGNGCMPGNYSNELSAVPGGVSTPTPTPTPAGSSAVTSDVSQPDQIPTDTPTDTPTPTPEPTVTPAPSSGSIVGTVVTVGTVLGVLIIFGVGIWIYVNYRRTRRPPPVAY